MLSRLNDDREWQAYWRSRSTPLGFAQAGWQVLRAGMARGLQKVSGRAVRPAYLSAADLELTSGTSTYQLNAAMTTRAGTAGVMSPDAVTWAGEHRRLFAEYLAGRAPESADPECYWNLHQFGWLFILVTQGLAGAKEARTAISRWLGSPANHPADPAWRSFSICERLGNWVHLMQIEGGGPFWSGLAQEMVRQAEHLARHLESFRDGSTNNHLLNNGRALYVAGALLERADLRRLGRTILIEEAGRQVTTEGFLDEGSSHYHLLFTRAYWEALRAAAAVGDGETQLALLPVVRSMLKASLFFRDPRAPEDWQMPFFGDISPDPPPGIFGRRTVFWHMANRAATDGLAVTDLQQPWFAESPSHDGRDMVASPLAPGWLCYPNSGYYRWSGSRITVWWHARRGGAPRRHAHNDWGSFHLHLDGHPVFVDPGRNAYCDEESGTYDGRRTLAQNALEIDGREQALFNKRALFIPAYLQDGADVEWKGNRESGELQMHVHGYRRLNPAVLHTRRFLLTPAACTVVDELAGQGQHQVIAAFHLHPAVRCTPDGSGCFRLETPGGAGLRFVPAPGGELRLKTGGHPGVPGGYCASQYGGQQPTTSIFATYAPSFPVRLHHHIVTLSLPHSALDMQ